MFSVGASVRPLIGPRDAIGPTSVVSGAILMKLATYSLIILWVEIAEWFPRLKVKVIARQNALFWQKDYSDELTAVRCVVRPAEG